MSIICKNYTSKKTLRETAHRRLPAASGRTHVGFFYTVKKMIINAGFDGAHLL